HRGIPTLPQPRLRLAINLNRTFHVTKKTGHFNLLPTAEIHCSSPFLARDGTLLYSGEVDSANTLPQATVAPSAVGKSFFSSVWFIVFIALALRLLVITIGHTYRITPRRDHFQFGWEMGRLARSIAEGHGFSSPTDLDSGPSAWTAPVYPYILAGIFKLFGVYTWASAWVILVFNSLFAALTCWTLFRIANRLFGPGVARATAWTWAVFPYLIYWPVRVVWEVSFTTFLLTLALWLAILARDRSPRAWDWI